MFIIKANRSSTSMARIRQWLILAMRTIAILALITALARPLLGGWLGWKLSGEPDTVIILLDRSASMGERFAPGISKLQKAVELISQAGEQSAASSHIVLIDSASLKVHQVPSWNTFKEMEDTRITQTSANFPAMYRAALDYMTLNTTGTTEVWSLSDMQQSNWRPSNKEWAELDTKFASLKQSVTFRALAISAKNSNNRSIYPVKFSSYPGETGGIVREVIFEIRADNAKGSSEIPLSLNENGFNRQITVTTSGPVTQLHHIVQNSDGKKKSYGYIALPPDSNSEDNVLYFGFAPDTPEQAVIISYNDKLAELLGTASAPEGKLRAQSFNIVSESEFNNLNLNSASIVICQIDPDKATLQKLQSFAKLGGYVLFIPPSNSERIEGSIWGKITSFKSGNEPFVADWNRQSGPFADTVSGEHLALDNIKLKKRVLLKQDSAIPTAFCSDSKPFLYAEKEEKGMIYYCTTLPLEDWSNFANGVVIVPMLRRLMQEGVKRISGVVTGICGLQHPDIDPAHCKNILSLNTNGGVLNPAYNTGIYRDGNRTIILNRPNAENLTGELDDATLKSLFANNPIRLFREKSDSSSKMQSEAWRIFLTLVILALLIEAYLCTPKSYNKE